MIIKIIVFYHQYRKIDKFHASKCSCFRMALIFIACVYFLNLIVKPFFSILNIFEELRIEQLALVLIIFANLF